MQDKVFTDQQLLESLASGCDQAFDVLFNKYLHKLNLFAREHCKDEETARELVMDVMLKFWQRRESAAEIKSIGAYLYSSVKNSIIDQYRKKAVQLCNFEELKKDPEETRQADTHLIESEFNKVFDKGVDKLSSQRRLIFEMRRDLNLSNKEIAEHLNITPKTVENHMTASLTFLKTYIRRNTDMVIPSVFILFFL